MCLAIRSLSFQPLPPAFGAVAERAPPEGCVQPLLALQSLQVLQSPIARAEERVAGEAVAVIGRAQLFDSARYRPVRLKRRKGFRDLAAVPTITARIRPGALRILHLAARQSRFNHLGQRADLVVLFRSPDVERLVVDELSRGAQDSEESPTDVFDVNQRSPRRSIALQHNLAGRMSEADEVVHHEIDAQRGGYAVCCGIAKERRAEILIRERRDISFGADLGFSVRRDGIELRVLS